MARAPDQSCLLDLLEQTDVCLLCKCQQFATCHSVLIVAEVQRA